MAIKIIVTGGTFDKEYNELNGELFFRQTHLGEMLALGRSRVRVRVKTLMMLDSLFMTAAHRRRILRECLASRERSVVITHGTDTMPQTAALLGPKIKDKTVVLTGAMVPYSVSGSDALFNLGTAFMAVQLVAPGVYICMNGRCFPWDRVRKNRNAGEFEGTD